MKAGLLERVRRRLSGSETIEAPTGLVRMVDTPPSPEREEDRVAEFMLKVIPAMLIAGVATMMIVLLLK